MNRYGRADGAVEQPDGVRAGMAGGGDELSEDARLLAATGVLIARRHPREEFLPGAIAHQRPHHLSLRSSSVQRRVTFLVRQGPPRGYISCEAMRRRI